MIHYRKTLESRTIINTIYTKREFGPAIAYNATTTWSILKQSPFHSHIFASGLQWFYCTRSCTGKEK